jgi:hypothetical protein
LSLGLLAGVVFNIYSHHKPAADPIIGNNIETNSRIRVTIYGLSNMKKIKDGAIVEILSLH